jgi:hypothetical protein
MPERQLNLLQSDLDEALRYLPQANDNEVKAFAIRQLRARQRLALLLEFYHKNHCRLARLQLLAACAIALGRFAGYSKSFDELGDAFMPVDNQGKALTQEWQLYAEACAARRPLEVRDEFWIAAHMKDLQAVRQTGLDETFDAEMREHENELTWRLLKQHMEVTFGARLMDHAALNGIMAYETAFGGSLILTVKRLFTTGWLLLGRYAFEAARALIKVESASRKEFVSYRRTALELMRYTINVWSASRVFRRGVRARERGSLQSEDGWSLLEEVLGERVREIHPMIVDFYTNPSHYDVKASLELKTLPAKFWSRLATLIIGQGLYESDEKEIDARFRVFRRKDGSMHFIRELYCGDAMRVFDSDFIIRQMNNKATLFEVFVDLKVDVEMEVKPLADKGLSIRGKNIYLRGLRLPGTGIQVEFQSHVVASENAGQEEGEQLHIDGHLMMQPRTRLGKFFACKVLRRPKQLACIHYVATPVKTINHSAKTVSTTSSLHCGD